MKVYKVMRMYCFFLICFDLSKKKNITTYDCKSYISCFVYLEKFNLNFSSSLLVILENPLQPCSFMIYCYRFKWCFSSIPTGMAECIKNFFFWGGGDLKASARGTSL